MCAKRVPIVLEDVSWLKTSPNCPVKMEKTITLTPQMWQPFESLRGEIDRMFDDFWRVSVALVVPRLLLRAVPPRRSAARPANTRQCCQNPVASWIALD